LVVSMDFLEVRESEEASETHRRCNRERYRRPRAWR
jgi:hypothetical protein